MRIPLVPVSIALCAAGAAVAGQGAELLPPEKVQAAGKALDVGEIGHAAPFVGDVDGDGKADLLVGVFGERGEGKVRVYRNEGTAKAPRFGEPSFLMAGGGVATVPVG